MYEQTFGPIAYLLFLVSATLNICAIASPDDNWMLWGNGLFSVLACLLLRLRGLVHFHTRDSEALFWASGACAIAYLILLKKRQEGFLFALSTMAAALYRTQETPYAPIIGYMLGYLTWGKVLCHRAQIAGGVLDLFVSLLYTTLFCEVALRPQCLYDEIWPEYYIYFTFSSATVL